MGHVSTEFSNVQEPKENNPSNTLESEGTLRGHSYSQNIKTISDKITAKEKKLENLTHTYNKSLGGHRLKNMIGKGFDKLNSIKYLEKKAKLPEILNFSINKIENFFFKIFPTSSFIEKKEAQLKGLKNELDTLKEQHHREMSLEKASEGILEVTVSPLKPEKDLTKEMEIENFIDEQGVCQAATGRCETVAETDASQWMKGERIFHTDDNISFSKFQDGTGCVLVNTDGEGNRESSDVYSNALNQGYQKAAILYHDSLTKASESGDDEKIKETLDHMANQAITEASEKFGATDVGERKKAGASTLGAVMSLPSSDANTVKVVGTVTYDTAVVVWNDEKKSFDYHVQPHGKNLEDSHQDWQAFKNQNFGNASPHFVHNVPKGTLVGVLTDGVLDNLPSATLNNLKKRPEDLKDLEGSLKKRNERDEVFQTVMQEKFDALTEIVNNPFFDDPKDPDRPPGLEFTVKDLPKAPEGHSIEITPDVARNRVMNYTKWATAELREIQAPIMAVEPVIMNSFNYKLSIPKDMPISEKIFNALDKKMQENFEKNNEDKIVAKFQLNLDLKFIKQEDYNKMPRSAQQTLDERATTLIELRQLDSEAETFKNEKDFTGLGTAQKKFNERNPNNQEAFENCKIISTLCTNEIFNANGITTKTDGVSAGFMKV